MVAVGGRRERPLLRPLLSAVPLGEGFVGERTAFGRLAEANRMLNYLETTGLLDAPAWRALVNESAKAIASASDDINGADDDVVTDDRQALE